MPKAPVQGIAASLAGRAAVAAIVLARMMVMGLGAENGRLNMKEKPMATPPGRETQLTQNRGGHVLTNTRVWSPDSRWIVYDVRSQDTVFDGARIERVNVDTGEVQVLYEARHGAACGVATYHPREDKVVFILGPENPTPDWSYSACHRQGVMVDAAKPGVAVNLDACDLAPPFTPGALRGGSHVHVFSEDGQWVSFTYEDHVLSRFNEETPEHDTNLRSVGVSVPVKPVRAGRSHPRNHDGEFFSVLVTRATAHPQPGSDEISKAFEEGWVGANGYCRAEGAWQKRALAFQGQVMTGDGRAISEVFIVDIPDDVTVPGEGPLAGTETRRPFPPKGVAQRRLTHTGSRKYPGLQGPRHWLRSSPDGSRIAFLMKDKAGIAQLWTVSPNGGEPAQLSRLAWPVASAFSWSPDGRHLACVADRSIFVIAANSGVSTRLTPRGPAAAAPLPQACVFSPDGLKIAYVRPVTMGGKRYDQIYFRTLSPLND